jgi:cytosine/adenosine deaminase-related metal-dependent hydrolase
MRVRVHAAHVLPVTSPPLAGGWVDVQDGRIVAMGAADTPTSSADADLDLGPVALMPALVNAHTHLELSHLRGRVPPSHGFIDWVKALLAARAATAPPSTDDIATAIDEARRSGTGAIGDIGNTHASVEALQGAGLDAWHFHEVLGFRGGRGALTADEAWATAADNATAAPQGGRLRFGVAPHAPYSTAPDLIAGVVAGLVDNPERRASLHLAESPEELQLLADGTGPWRALLEEFGTWDAAWAVPACPPVEYLRRIGGLHARLLIVHGTQLTVPELQALAGAKATLVLCARSNAWVGVGAPPVDGAFASGVRIAVGTDSLASVANLNLFEELAALRRLAPSVPAGRLVEAATRGGAEALGFDDLGAIASGRSARLLAVHVPAGVDDVEEWLVSGAVTPDAVRWLDACLHEARLTEGAAG